MRDKKMRTPLFYGIYHNNYDLTNYLLETGADTLYTDSYGRTVLHYTCILGLNKNIMLLLLDYNQ